MLFQHHVAFDRFGFKECLIDEHGPVFLGAQAGQRLGRGGRYMGFFRGDLLNRLGAAPSFSGRRNDE